MLQLLMTLQEVDPVRDSRGRSKVWFDDKETTMVKKILFIGPVANRSGAPILLLHLIRWMKRETNYEMAVALSGVGPILSEFEALLPTTIYYPPAFRSPWVRGLAKQKQVAGMLRKRRVRRFQAGCTVWPPDLIFCANVSSAEILDELGPHSCPVITGVHEMEYVLKSIYHKAAASMRRHATHYIAGSDAVRINLMKHHAVPPDRVTVVHDFIPTADFELPPPGKPTQRNPALLGGAGIPPGAAVIGIIATVEWRKGSELLVPLSRLLPAIDANGRPVHLVWVGGGNEIDMAQLAFDVATAEVAERVHLAGPTARTADWYPAFTVLAVLSREDPFPLVVVEAAACGVPVVCFQNSGGVPELVETDAGRAVPFLDLGAFAAALMEIINQPVLRETLGRTAAQKARTRYDVAVCAPMVIDCIRNEIDRSTAKPT